ncbi:MAG: dTDP-glucose 4,6-dehydratase, partial [Dehalococcoidia bacterium]|nr:dTDP-glucose 4,6-dehydratase [Dehalococcoidia bacterium]
MLIDVGVTGGEFAVRLPGQPRAVHSYEDSHDDTGSNPSSQRWIGDIIEARFSRRAGLQGLVGAAGLLSIAGEQSRRVETTTSLTFEEVPRKSDQGIRVAPGYRAQVLLRWGDKVLPDAPPFDPYRQTAAAQAKQFGYNCDFVAYMPLPFGSQNGGHGLLCVNHEYTSTHLMFPRTGLGALTEQEQVNIELAAHGHSVVEIKWVGGVDGRWDVVYGGYNRRITPLDTEIRLSGPAAGHPRLRTRADPTGTRVIGTLNNCGGGITPWGTLLIAEENFHQYFSGNPAGTAEAQNYKRYGFRDAPTCRDWCTYHERFTIEQEPHEPNRFGWAVEYDPYDPESIPVKRTALGRFKREAATTAVNEDGRVVVYSGDDEQFEYVYKFVSERPYDPADRSANRDLLDEGTLYVAKFEDDGTMRWLPLVFGQS